MDQIITVLAVPLLVGLWLLPSIIATRTPKFEGDLFDVWSKNILLGWLPAYWIRLMLWVLTHRPHD
jgi:hypothetical protein